MSKSVNNQEDAIDIIKWGEELDELDSSAFAGRSVTDEEFTEIAESYVNGTYLNKYLEKVRAKKQDLLAKVAELETIEKEIKEQIDRQEQKR